MFLCNGMGMKWPAVFYYKKLVLTLFTRSGYFVSLKCFQFKINLKYIIKNVIFHFRHF